MILYLVNGCMRLANIGGWFYRFVMHRFKRKHSLNLTIYKRSNLFNAIVLCAWYNLFIAQVAEVPCVIEAGVESITKTKQAVTLMKAIGAYDDVEKAKESRKVSWCIWTMN